MAHGTWLSVWLSIRRGGMYRRLCLRGLLLAGHNHNINKNLQSDIDEGCIQTRLHPNTVVSCSVRSHRLPVGCLVNPGPVLSRFPGNADCQLLLDSSANSNGAVNLFFTVSQVVASVHVLFRLQPRRSAALCQRIYNDSPQHTHPVA